MRREFRDVHVHTSFGAAATSRGMGDAESLADFAALSSHHAHAKSGTSSTTNRGASFAKKRRVDLARWLVDEAIRVEHGENLGTLRIGNAAMRTATLRVSRAHAWPKKTVGCRSAQADRKACPRQRDLRVALLDELDESSSELSSIPGSATPRISCAFR